MFIEECLNCGTFFAIDKVHKDALCHHVICPECNSSMNVNFEFECNISEEYKDENYVNDWGCAYAWYGENIGVEYNFCIDNEENCSAIYKLKFNDKTGHMETVTDKFEHYEINFDDVEWEKKLAQAMYEALEKFINEEIVG